MCTCCLFQTDIFARTWGEQFERAEVLPSPQLPLVTEKDFERYLHKLRKTGVLNNPFPTKNRTDLTENAVLKAVRGVTPSRRFPSVNQNTTSQGMFDVE
ncbi:hypothetical protein FGIG_05567 [Fasciola gigantica]|uniref:Uncharacterized protein n=1 Tax=Fasciola gigantica TaxID=46835 RepID=A0A504YC28_FASGI|nr:hypothetical protein FGIG_05567 [Fasciola gigantica]